MNPLTDYGFKKIFGDEEIMRAFLTDLLEPASPIKTINFLDKELGAETESERGVIYDLRCETEDGKRFIVEMQNRSQSHFSDRILFYLSRSFSLQEKKGALNWNYALEPVYGIFFLNFKLSGFKARAKRTIQLKVEETNEVFSDKLRAYTLELPSFREKPLTFPKEKIEYWLYNLANMETMTNAIPYQDKQPAFKKMGNISELVRMTPEELSKYNISLDVFRTNYSVMENERAEGLKQGIQQGIQQGISQSKYNTAKKMIEKGYTAEEIADITGLPEEEVSRIFIGWNK
ncbi:MAG: Rpn family recombination-promoting nuclease/putative transposase [Paludibacteraceae bacterium]|nr:Rpn family recombination-promoting nuclease/putative transposase [Paludibacteraceae bacterium]